MVAVSASAATSRTTPAARTHVEETGSRYGFVMPTLLLR
jgi:hypothetical protein